MSASAPAWLDELQLSPGPPWHAMGTRALDEPTWLVVDDERDAELAYKARLLGLDPTSIVASTPAAVDAEVEVAAMIAAHTGATLDPDLPPLVAAALAVQEDLCVLVRDGGGRWILAAGVVCFPSMWRLSDKVGLPLAAVHGPVPAYADELAERVDRFVDRLRVERPVRRRNWLVHDSPELHLPEPPPPPASPPDVPDGLWLRSERQTLRRLPVTGAVLFTIRTQQVPLAVVAERPDVAAGMAAAVRGWSPDLLAYRRAQPWREPVLAWLDAHSPLPAGPH